MNKELHNELEKLIEHAYVGYSSPSSILDRTRALTPLFAALTAGYIYSGGKLTHHATTVYGVIFWTPFILGVVSLIISILSNLITNAF